MSVNKDTVEVDQEGTNTVEVDLECSSDANEKQPVPESTGENDIDNKKINVYNVVNLIAYLLNVVVTYGIGQGFIGDTPTNGDLSLKYQTLVTPVGWFFAVIWSLIFIGQLVWSLVQLLVPSQRNNPFVKAVGFKYLLVVLAQIGWTFSFAYEVIWLSLIFMVILCGFLWSIVLALRKCQLQEGTATMSIFRYLLWWFPFTSHTGWITAATAVNVNVVIVEQQASGSVQFWFAVVSLAVLFIVSCVTAIKRLDKTIPLVVAWALFGVFTELHTSPDESILDRFTEIQIESAKYSSVCLASIIVVLVACTARPK